MHDMTNGEYKESIVSDLLEEHGPTAIAFDDDQEALDHLNRIGCEVYMAPHCWEGIYRELQRRR